MNKYLYNAFQNNRALSFILLVGFVLRVATIFWGIPIFEYIHSYHPDESKAYSITVNFPSNYLSHERFKVYGNTVAYLLGTLFLPFKAFVVWVIGDFRYYIGFVWIASRFFTALFGTLCIYLSYRLAEMVFDKKTALIGAALLATSFYHTLNSAVATLDVPVSLFLVANFLLCFRALKNPSKLNYVIFGIFTALMIGTKVTAAVFLAVPFLLNLFELLDKNRSEEVKLNTIKSRVSLLTIYLIVTGVTFLIFHPNIFLDPERYIAAYWYTKFRWADRYSFSFYSMLDLWFYSSGIAMGIPVVILGLCGFLFARTNQWQFKCVFLLIVSLIYLAWTTVLPPRFLIPVAPIFCIFAGGALGKLIQAKRNQFRAVGYILIACTLTHSLYYCFQGILIRFNDIRPAAARYIGSTIPPGSKIALSSLSEKHRWDLHKWRYPKIYLTKYEEVELWENPEFVIAASTDLEKIKYGLNSSKLNKNDEWEEEGNVSWYNRSAPSPRIFRFYASLLNPDNSPYEIKRAFKTSVSVPIEFEPPEIIIYQLRKSCSQRP